MVIVHLANLFKIRGAFQALDELVVQRLKHIDLQVRVDIVHQEAHMLPQLHSLPEELII